MDASQTLPATQLPDPQTLIPGDDARAILHLRLLIARAANKDSLHWWDDDSLSGAAAFIFNRTFPTAPALAARSLALRAAFARHQAVASQIETLHLYRLDSDNSDQLVLEFWPLLEFPVPEAPITTIDALHHELLAITGTPMPYRVIGPGPNAGLQITLPDPPPAVSLLLHRAQTLAWAYLKGDNGRPCIPYILE